MTNTRSAIPNGEMNDRYKRIRQLGWDPQLLSQAHILVVGAGALGNEVLKNLALLGVGMITVVDMDEIESHNLTRSVLFRSSDVGKSKATTAAQRVLEINPDAQVCPIVGPVQESLGLGAFLRFDAVLGCLDNGQARFDVGRGCWQTNTLFVDAGLDHLNGDVRVYLPPDSACFACNLSKERRQTLGNRHRCLQLRMLDDRPAIPTAPTISSFAAGWQTQIAVKYLHNAPIPTGKRQGLHGLTDEMFQYVMTPNPECIESGEHTLLPFEKIIRTELSIQSTTPSKLIETAMQHKPQYAQHAVVDLGFDFVESAECQICHRKKELRSRKDHLYIDQVTCCGALMRLDETYQIALQDKENDATLAELGVPPLDLVLVKDTHNPDSRQWLYYYFELGGDEKNVFGDLPVHFKTTRRE